MFVAIAILTFKHGPIILPQRDQAIVACREDASTSMLEELKRAFRTATNADRTDTTVYKQVADRLEAIQKLKADPAQQVITNDNQHCKRHEITNVLNSCLVLSALVLL